MRRAESWPRMATTKGMTLKIDRENSTGAATSLARIRLVRRGDRVERGERRAAARRTVALDGTLRLGGATAGGAFPARVVDLSLRGALLLGPPQLRRLDRVLLTLEDGERVEGVVVRVRHLEAGSSLAVAFDGTIRA
jgi:hypothetical protein